MGRPSGSRFKAPRLPTRGVTAKVPQLQPPQMVEGPGSLVPTADATFSRAIHLLLYLALFGLGAELLIARPAYPDFFQQPSQKASPSPALHLIALPSTLPPEASPPAPALVSPAAQPLSGTRAIIDALRSAPVGAIPQAAREALASLGIADFASEARSSPTENITFPLTGHLALVCTPNNVLPFWRLLGAGGWEMATFRVYRAVLTAKPGVVIDFGSWIGPTLLAAAHAPSTRVYGFEVDPVAFSQLALNIALNPYAAEKTSVFFMGISDAAKVLEFSSGACTKGLGDSCSSAVSDSLVPSNRWSVQTMPLAMFVEEEGIHLEEISLIKVDTEGAEVFILPSLTKWLRSWPGARKPAFWLSLHGTFLGAHPPWRADAAAFMQLFNYGYLAGNDGLTPVWAQRENVKGPDGACSQTCTYLLSDNEVQLD